MCRLTFLLAWVLCSQALGAQDEPVETVPHVDLSRYAGKWFEIARFPHRFQKDCVGSTAEYRLRADGDS